METAAQMPSIFQEEDWNMTDLPNKTINPPAKQKTNPKPTQIVEPVIIQETVSQEYTDTQQKLGQQLAAAMRHANLHNGFGIWTTFAQTINTHAYHNGQQATLKHVVEDEIWRQKALIWHATQNQTQEKQPRQETLKNLQKLQAAL